MSTIYILVLVAFLGPEQQMTGVTTAEFTNAAACLSAGQAAEEAGGLANFHLKSGRESYEPRIKWRCSRKEEDKR